MRLTLRTLLAYLDDILEPAQAREIGAKIAESTFATSLVDRIRDVMRRRRLTAPELHGPGSGLDPNIVAEYLDNVLPPDKVADVERVCLESDVHLAEMAACHQILTLALGEPIQVSRESRESIYALGPLAPTQPPDQRSDGESKAAESVSAAPALGPGLHASRRGRGEVAAPTGREADQENRFEDIIPDYLKPKPLWRRGLPYVVVGLIAAAWIGLLIYGPPIKPDTAEAPGWQQPSSERRQKGKAGIEVAANGKAASKPQPTKPTEQQPAAVRSAATAEAEKPHPAKPSPAAAPPSIDPLPPPDEPEQVAEVVEPTPPAEIPLPAGPNGPPVNEPPEQTLQTPKNVVAAVNPVPVPKEIGRAAVQPAAEPAADVPTLQYNSPDGILLRYEPQQQDWLIMPHRAIVHPGERLASPEPFDALIDIGGSRLRATLLGGTAVTIVPPSQAAPVGFEIEQGRLTLRRSEPPQPGAVDNSAVPLALALRDRLWRLELLTPGTVCGIEVTLLQPEQPGQVLAPNNYTGALYVISGSVRLADGGGKVTVIEGKDWLSLSPNDGQQPAAKPPLLAVPEWLDPAAKPTLTWRRFADLFEKEFYVGDPPATLPLSENVPPMIKHNRAYISALAVKCLALVGGYESLASALNADHQESRAAAVEGLRNWLASAEGNGELLEEALAKQFPDEEVRIISRLLWGYSKKDAHDFAASQQLVDWLTHNNLVIRELAFYHIYRLTGRKYDYHPMRPAAQREAAVRRWQDHVEKEGALIGQ